MLADLASIEIPPNPSVHGLMPFEFGTGPVNSIGILFKRSSVS